MSRRNEITLTQLRYFATAAERRSMTEAARELFVANGVVYLRGQVGQDLDTAESVGVGDVAAQAEQAMANIGTLLAEAGGTLEDIVKVVVYLTDIRFREPVYRVMGRWLMVEAWHLGVGQPVESRLLAAFRAAMAAGGEAGPVHSAGLSVIAGYGWRVTDLRVDWSDDPLAALDAVLAVWLPQRDDYITRALRPEASPGYGVPGDDR